MFDFAEATQSMTAAEILNYYRNLYYAEPQVTERGIVANAINDILTEYYHQQSKIEAQKMDIRQLQNDVINANCNLDHITMQLECERAEAIKEFAEKLKEMLEWTTEPLDEYDIDNLVKEMTEEHDAKENSI